MTNRTFSITKQDIIDSYIENLYKSKTFSFQEGVTFLAGCNGYGKSTLLKIMANQFDRVDIPYYNFSSIRKTEERGLLADAGKFSFKDYITSMFLSEGEKKVDDFTSFAEDIGKSVFINQDGEFWILIDSLDSGLSIDNIEELKDFFTNTVYKTKPKTQNLYIVISSNNYAFLENEDCIDVRSSNHIRFSSYDDFRSFILETRKIKDSEK